MRLITFEINSLHYIKAIIQHVTVIDVENNTLKKEKKNISLLTATRLVEFELK